MIFYFSGTGNSAWVAQQLARLTGDEAYDITNLKEPPNIAKAKQISFVFPVYAWGAPEIMVNFTKKVPKTDAFSFGACTCGGDVGLTMKQFTKFYSLSISYSLLMPNNYIIGSDTDTESVILKKITAARKELARMALEIRQQTRVCQVHEGTLAGVKSHLANFGLNKFARSAKPFFIEDSCNGCGQCARNCPASSILLHDGKPVWAAQCFQCLLCINECPQQSIQYGKSTVGRRRYTIRTYLPQDKQ